MQTTNLQLIAIVRMLQVDTHTHSIAGSFKLRGARSPIYI